MDMKPKNLLKRVLQFAREELERRARAQDEAASALAHDRKFSGVEPDRPLSEVQLRAPSEGDQAGRSDVHGLEVVRSPAGGSLMLRWAVTEADVTRALSLIRGHPVLCLRLVSFSKARDDVLREVQDRPGVELAGQCEIGEPAQRAVVSLGLRAGERFVSIAHHVL